MTLISNTYFYTKLQFDEILMKFSLPLLITLLVEFTFCISDTIIVYFYTGVAGKHQIYSINLQRLTIWVLMDS